MEQQSIQVERKPLYCRNNCGIEITFDNRKSKSGKSIPIDKSSGLPHQCPKSPYALKHSGEQPKPKDNGQTQSVTREQDEDTVFSLLMEINRKLDLVLRNSK